MHLNCLLRLAELTLREVEALRALTDTKHRHFSELTPFSSASASASSSASSSASASAAAASATAASLVIGEHTHDSAAPLLRAAPEVVRIEPPSSHLSLASLSLLPTPTTAASLFSLPTPFSSSISYLIFQYYSSAPAPAWRSALLTAPVYAFRARRLPPSAAGPQSKPYEFWRCGQCSWINDLRSLLCSECQASKGMDGCACVVGWF